MYNAPYCKLTLVDRYGEPRAEALVDRTTCQVFAPYRWWLDSGGYARRSVPGGGRVLMHRAVVGLSKGDDRMVDHINRNKLDNRRSNLRVVDAQTNRFNLPAHRGAMSPYRGVWWEAPRERWRADVRVEGRRIRLGRHKTDLDAALAIECWRVAHGPYGWERDPALP